MGVSAMKKPLKTIKIDPKLKTVEYLEIEFEGLLKTMQGIVGGYIETVLIDGRLLIVNEEGRLLKDFVEKNGRFGFAGFELLGCALVAGVGVTLDGDFIDTKATVEEIKSLIEWENVR